MSFSGFIIGLVASLGYINSFISPLLVWLNWINLTFSIIGMITSLVGTIQGRHQFFGAFGIILNGTILILSVLRLLL